MITVREMINPNDPIKNVIIVMSDLHLNSIWCHKEAQRIEKFIIDLMQISKVGMEEMSDRQRDRVTCQRVRLAIQRTRVLVPL